MVKFSWQVGDHMKGVSLSVGGLDGKILGSRFMNEISFIGSIKKTWRLASHGQ